MKWSMPPKDPRTREWDFTQTDTAEQLTEEDNIRCPDSDCPDCRGGHKHDTNRRMTLEELKKIVHERC